MKPDNIELCSALVIVGGVPTVIKSVRDDALQRLVELGFVQMTDGNWRLTAAGHKLLPAIQAGDTLPELT